MSTLQHGAKRDCLRKALIRNDTVYVHFDPRQADFTKPVNNMYSAHMCIQMGYNMALPMGDYEHSATGFQVTLSFDRKPSTLWVPWGAVFAIVGSNDKGTQQWPESMDPFVRECVRAAPASQAETPSNVIRYDFKRKKRL